MVSLEVTILLIGDDQHRRHLPEAVHVREQLGGQTIVTVLGGGKCQEVQLVPLQPELMDGLVPLVTCLIVGHITSHHCKQLRIDSLVDNLPQITQCLIDGSAPDILERQL